MDESSNPQDLPPGESTLLIEFLTTAAGLFASELKFPHLNPRDLRQSVLGIKPSSDNDLPSLSQLRSQVPSDFLEFIISRYGESGLSLNLLRMSLCQHLRRSRALLNAFGEGLLGRAKLVFNRPFSIYSENVCLKRTFYSSVLVELAGIAANSSETLDTVVGELNKMLPSVAEDSETQEAAFDDKLAKYLGFSGLFFQVVPLATERRSIRKIAESFNIFADSVSASIEQLAKNQHIKGVTKLLLVCEEMQADALRLLSYKVPNLTNLEGWDYFRQSLDRCIVRLNTNLEELTHAILGVVSVLDADRKQPQFPRSVSMILTTSLMTRGWPAKEAQATIAKLIHYCETHGLAPTQVIPQELSKIHPGLDQDFLNIFVRATPSNLSTPGGTEERDRTLKETSRLGNLFEGWRTPLITSLVLALLVVSQGCGVKTAPKSDIEDFRPKIPFRGPAVPPAEDEPERAGSGSNSDTLDEVQDPNQPPQQPKVDFDDSSEKAGL